MHWVFERTFGWYNFGRVLARDYEHTTASVEGWVTIAGICQTVQRCVLACHVEFIAPRDSFRN